MTTTPVLAPVPGRAVRMEEVPDPVFAQLMVGPGAAVDPPRGVVDAVAPVSGTVLKVLPHAFVILTADGLGILVHLGIDTVQLDGKGFTPAVQRGQRVHPGDLLAEIDLKVINEAGYDPTTIVVVTNSAQLTSVEAAATGTVEQGRPVLTVAI